MVDIHTLRAAPKVALHDHLDGGLRPQSVIDLAAEVGHELPAADAESLGDWFFEAADSGTLVRYLETFDHTIAVTRTASALHRVAKEFVEDQAADGVVYAEARWAPAQHVGPGLGLGEAIEAVRDGLAEGMQTAAEAGHDIIARQIITGMRQHVDVLDIADLAVRYRDDSVAGFDIAGPEDGFPPSRHQRSFDRLRAANARFTVHAGEAHGVRSIWEAVHLCGAQRIGHGVRLVDDISETADGLQLGRMAAYIRDLRIPLEVCPSSNLQTGIAPSIAEHPIDVLVRAGMRVTVSCDNRLMSRTSLSREFSLLSEAFGYDLDTIEWITLNSAKSAFLPHDQRLALINEVIKPGYARLRTAG
ncbi:adenosine deaminase [Naumannella halotolerans]|uniref:adenosine deaminase n=1 Tax=Naumannella halotolerans TaxID=993414 RepID=A0A4R7J9G1_9ACTN|nr:adenosine deaminase [Naumannella halotolerans]TDT34162.1 adenosine deaminase [Naumannella halotolerans]